MSIEERYFDGLNKLREQTNWNEWMSAWISVRKDTTNGMWELEVYTCYYPDMYAFLITSDPEAAVNGFEKFPYKD